MHSKRRGGGERGADKDADPFQLDSHEMRYFIYSHE